MLKITIPKPCHKDWNAMTPNEHGRHCSSCAKTVTDFTSMSDEEVKHFFINKKEEHTCGRFKNDQLHRIAINLPENILYIDMPLWKKFLAACLIIFSTTLFSCDTTINGDAVLNKQLGGVSLNETQNKDSLSHLTVGNFLKWDSTIKINLPPPPVCGVTYGFTVTVGEIIPEAAVQIIDTLNKKISDTMPTGTATILLDSTTTEKKDTVKIDSTNCEKTIYY
jgi:hypothetical protein